MILDLAYYSPKLKQMADSFNKKEREKKRRKRKKEKQERKEQRKQEGNKEVEFMYVDENGNLTPTPPDPAKKEVKLEDINISTPKKSELEEEEKVRDGKVKFFNTEKGYGFINDKKTGESYFIHVNNLTEPIEEGDQVTFEIGTGPKGQIAINVNKK